MMNTDVIAVRISTFFLLVGLSYAVNANGTTQGFSLKDLESEENLRKLYDSWAAIYGLIRNSPSEKEKRFRTFNENIHYIEMYNKLARTTDNYLLGLNEYADLTREEFKNRFSNSQITQNRVPRASSYRHPGRSRLPVILDWRQQGAVTGVKNQGRCKSSWAFSSTGAVEGINKIVTGSLVSLSEQELLNCASASSTSGCDGGRVDQAFQFIVDNGGIETEDDWPYRATQDSCNGDALHNHTVSIDGYEYAPVNNERELKTAVARQPVSVWIEATNNDLQFYSSGVFIGKCGNKVDHAVLIVGYGSSHGRPFWRVKNSWGSSWGEKGYIRIERNYKSVNGKCGIAVMPSYPVKKAGTKSPPSIFRPWWWNYLLQHL